MSEHSSRLRCSCPWKSQSQPWDLSVDVSVTSRGLDLAILRKQACRCRQSLHFLVVFVRKREAHTARAIQNSESWVSLIHRALAPGHLRGWWLWMRRHFGSGRGEHLPRSCQQPMNRQGLWWRRRSWMLKFTALEKMPRHLRSLSEAQLTDPRRGGWDSALGALWNPLGKWLQAPVLLFPFPDRSHKCSYVMRAEQKPFWKWALPLKVHRNRFWGIPKPFIVLKFCFIRCCWRIRFLLARSYSPFYSGGVLVCNVITGWLFGEEGVRSRGA